MAKRINFNCRFYRVSRLAEVLRVYGDTNLTVRTIWLKQMATQSNFFRRQFCNLRRAATGLIALLACVATIASADGQSSNSFTPAGNRDQLPLPEFSNGPSATPPSGRAFPAQQKVKPIVPPATSRPATGRSIPGRTRSSQSSAQTQSIQRSEDGSKINVRYCSIEFVDDIKLPALEAGAIVAINVEEGQFIAAGTIVGQIDDSLPHFELERAKMRYKNAFQAYKDTSSISAARKKFELASSVYDKNNRLMSKGSRSPSEVKESRFRKEIAKLEIEKAENDRQMALGEAKVELAGMESVKQRISRHTLRSEYNAYVVDIERKPQEYVNIGDEVMRLARMDQMWVQASMNANLLNAADAENRPVTVTLQTADGEEKFDGKIDQVSLEMVSAQEYQVKVKVQNRKDGNSWMLRPFSSVSMVIHMDRDPISDEASASRAQQAQLPLSKN